MGASLFSMGGLGYYRGLTLYTTVGEIRGKYLFKTLGGIGALIICEYRRNRGL